VRRGRLLRLRALAAPLFLAASLVGTLTAAPRAAALGPLPPCRLADFMTVPRDYDSWSTTLVDWLLGVGRDYVPPDLVSVREAGIGGAGMIRAVAIDDLRAMADAAAKTGTPIAVSSAYRSYDEQVKLFNDGTATYGHDNAILFWQQPGHSEHQLGLAIDFMSAGGGSPTKGDWATTPAGKWMFANAWKYGWVLSYPKDPAGKLFSEITCFHYEPWHYRYVGRDIAVKIHDSGLTTREYLWTNFTMVDPVTGQALPTPTPTPSPTPLPTPTASPTPTPTEVATASETPEGGTSAGRWFGVDAALILGGAAAIGLVAIGLAAGMQRSRRRRIRLP